MRLVTHWTHPIDSHSDDILKSSGVCAVLGFTEKFTLRGPTRPNDLCRGSMSVVVTSSVSTWRGGANCTIP